MSSGNQLPDIRMHGSRSTSRSFDELGASIASLLIYLTGRPGHRRLRYVVRNKLSLYDTLSSSSFLIPSTSRQPFSPKSFVHEVTETDPLATQPGMVVSGKQTTIYPKERYVIRRMHSRQARPE